MPEDKFPPTEVGLLDLAELEAEVPLKGLAFWRENLGGAAMPPVAAIDPMKLKAILQNIVLIDVIWPQPGVAEMVPQDFRFRLVGQHSVDAHGADTTGMMVSTLSTFGTEYVRMATAFYRLICARKEPVAVRGPLKMIGKDYRQFEAVYLPFSADGTRVDRIMAAVRYD